MIHILDLKIEDDLYKLKTFSELEHPNTFRYFKNRDFFQAIKTHIVTLMYSNIGYAHIDYDKTTNRHYLGICVLPEYQSKGIGNKLINVLLKLFTGDIFLTVDVNNINAIKLYEKNGFISIENNENFILYKRSKNIVLQTSLGEAVDKLTILDIKLENIKDTNKQIECKKEFDYIHSNINNYIENDYYSYLYKCLKYINNQIWILQDNIRDRDLYSKENFNKILDLNDMRFRVKKKINLKFNSEFQEQKGYKKRNGIFLTHLGLGDLVNMNGAIRYAALLVDNLYVICKTRNFENISEMFEDDSSIIIVKCKDDDSDIVYITNELHMTKAVTHTFYSGCWCGSKNYNNLPYNFYNDLHFNHDIKRVFNKINYRKQLSIPSIPYIFLHSSSSTTGDIELPKHIDINKILVINPNKNMYCKDHIYYEESEKYVNKPFLHYIDTIQNALELHLTDSSFYCLASCLNLKASVKMCYDRNSGKIIKYYNFQ